MGIVHLFGLLCLLAATVGCSCLLQRLQLAAKLSQLTLFVSLLVGAARRSLRLDTHLGVCLLLGGQHQER